VQVAPRAPTTYVANGTPAPTYAPAQAYATAPAQAYAPAVTRVPAVAPPQRAIAQATAAYAQPAAQICNQMLANGCYLAMRKFSTPAGTELRCAMICE
jgi:hypothetical protein